MLRIYFYRLPEEEREFPTELLSAYRKERMAAQKDARKRMQSLCSEFLLRRGLRDLSFPADGPLEIAADEHGKPFLKNGRCFFSISHSADAALCAVCDREIGADIQIKTNTREDLLRRFFAEDEQTFIHSAADPAAAFTEIWTKKESYCKMDGRGLALQLGSFSVFDRSIAPVLRHGTAGEYHLAVCTEAAATEEPEWIEIKTGALFL